MKKNLLLLSVLACAAINGMSEPMTQEQKNQFPEHVYICCKNFKDQENTNAAVYHYLNSAPDINASTTRFQQIFAHMTDEETKLLNEYMLEVLDTLGNKQMLRARLSVLTEVLIPLKKVNSALKKDGKNLLHLSIHAHVPEIAIMLIKNKIFDIESEDCIGFTPLVTAVSLGKEQLIKDLIALGANVNVKKHGINLALGFATDKLKLYLAICGEAGKAVSDDFIKKYNNIIAMLEAAGAKA